jgi:hypothetical protein
VLSDVIGVFLRILKHSQGNSCCDRSWSWFDPIKINHEALIIGHGRVGPNHTVVNGHARIQLRSLGFMQAGQNERLLPMDKQHAHDRSNGGPLLIVVGQGNPWRAITGFTHACIDPPLLDRLDMHIHLDRSETCPIARKQRCCGSPRT